MKPPPVKARPPAAGVLKPFTSTVESVERQNRELVVRADRLGRSLTRSREETGRTLKKVEILKNELERRPVTQEELNEIYSALDEAMVREAWMIKESDELKKVVSDQRDSIDAARRDLETAQSELEKKDAEVEALRSRVGFYEKTVDVQAKKISETGKALRKAEIKIGKLEMYRNIVWWVIGILAAYCILRVLKLTPQGRALLFWLP